MAISPGSRAEYMRDWHAANPGMAAEYNRRSRMRRRPPCKWCGGPVPYPSPGAGFCGDGCRRLSRAAADKARRQALAQELWDFKTAQGCSRCGYDRCGAALDYHHPDPNKERRFTVRGWKTAAEQAERDKCVLLCANCHREEHSWLRS